MGRSPQVMCLKQWGVYEHGARGGVCSCQGLPVSPWPLLLQWGPGAGPEALGAESRAPSQVLSRHHHLAQLRPLEAGQDPGSPWF